MSPTSPEVHTIDGREIWFVNDVAEHFGLESATVHRYRAAKKGYLPPEAGTLGRKIYWWADDVVGWRRIGRGARTDLQENDS